MSVQYVLCGHMSITFADLWHHRYIISPMNRGNNLWNQLTYEEQTTFSNPLFKLILDSKYKVYIRLEMYLHLTRHYHYILYHFCFCFSLFFLFL